MEQTGIVRAFKETRAERAVDTHRGIDDSVCHVFMEHTILSSVSPASTVVESVMVRKQSRGRT
jgi:hypothetical protein